MAGEEAGAEALQIRRWLATTLETFGASSGCGEHFLDFVMETGRPREVLAAADRGQYEGMARGGVAAIRACPYACAARSCMQLAASGSEHERASARRATAMALALTKGAAPGDSGAEIHPDFRPFLLEHQAEPLVAFVLDGGVPGPELAAMARRALAPAPPTPPATVPEIVSTSPSEPMRIEIGTDDEGFLVVDNKRVKGPKDAFMRAAPPHQRQHALSLLALAEGREVRMTMRDYAEVSGLALPFKLVPADGVTPKGRERVRVVAAALDPEKPPPVLFASSMA